eukprot:6175550-Pleurochrysis_carterae.AAC.3
MARMLPVDWLHVNEGARKSYTGFYTRKCVILCLPKLRKRYWYALRSHSACSKKRKSDSDSTQHWPSDFRMSLTRPSTSCN